MDIEKFHVDRQPLDVAITDIANAVAMPIPRA
jgi:hypothetical protein